MEQRLDKQIGYSWMRQLRCGVGTPEGFSVIFRSGTSDMDCYLRLEAEITTTITTSTDSHLGFWCGLIVAGV